MPIKRRKDKRRATVAPEAWDMMFKSGHDYFGDLDPLGLPNRLRLPIDDRMAAEAAWDEATREAWGMYGAAYLRQWREYRSEKAPWALETYGEPEMKGGSNAN
ncbi:MAG: hypothetical protein P8N72_08875 [Flavimaricola sp.]|nr:hypothetical protein [Flavimaricola sp.]